MAHRYPTDLTDDEWALIAPYLAPARIARPRKHHERDIFDALLYVLRTGCSWRMIPNDLVPWRAAYHHFKRWSEQGTLATVNDILIPLVRKKGGVPLTHTRSLLTLGRANPPTAEKP